MIDEEKVNSVEKIMDSKSKKESHRFQRHYEEFVK